MALCLRTPDCNHLDIYAESECFLIPVTSLYGEHKSSHLLNRTLVCGNDYLYVDPIMNGACLKRLNAFAVQHKGKQFPRPRGASMVIISAIKKTKTAKRKAPGDVYAPVKRVRSTRKDTTAPQQPIPAQSPQQPRPSNAREYML